jgi:hypothetical protein
VEEKNPGIIFNGLSLPELQKSENDPGWNRGVMKFWNIDRSREFFRNWPKNKNPVSNLETGF